MSTIEISNNFHWNPRFNGVFSRNNLFWIRDEAFAINLEDKQSKETYWVSSVIDRNSTVYLDSFGVEYFPQEVLNKIRDKSITHNIFRIESDGSIMCGFYCIGFIEYILAEKTLLDYANLFSPNDYEKNGKSIRKFFKNRYVMSRV